MQQRKQSFLKKVLTVAEDKGFYIILAVCIIAIGVSGYVLFFSGNEGVDADAPKAPVLSLTTPKPSKPIVKPPVIKEPIKPSAEVQKPTAPKPEPTKPSEPSQTTAKPINVKQIQYVKPIQGKVTRDFSGDTLVLDPTMADWRTHNGTDFACAAGAEVLAIADGTVSGVFTDGLKGNCVSLTHDGKLVSTYCGLAPNETMKTGMSVKAGQAIGKAGNTMITESAQESHVHIEITKKGTYIDAAKLNFK